MQTVNPEDQPLTGSGETPKPQRNVIELKPPLQPTLLRSLWVRMAEIFGHKWTSSFGDDPEGSAAATWAKGLRGMSSHQLARGLEACVASADPWPPTLPDFRARCLGIPTLPAVKLALRSASRRPIFVHLVWQFVDSAAYGAANPDKAERLLRDAYELAREHVMRTGELVEQEPMAAIEADDSADRPAWRIDFTPKPKEHVAQVIARARAQAFRDMEDASA